MNKLLLTAMGCIVFWSYGCSSPILKQDIPVSTNPMGAKIFANGQLVGQTPTTISLDRNREHILTLVKNDYRQEDVIIKRQYQQDKVLMRSVQSGVDAGLFFKDARMGVQRSAMSMYNQEHTGEAYVLVPVAVTVDLTPLDVSRAGANTGAVKAQKRSPASQPPVTIESAPIDRREVSKELLKTGITAATAQSNPLEKKWETSSSSRSYTKPDGTRVQEKSSTKAGVGIDPAGLVDVINVLFK